MREINDPMNGYTIVFAYYSSILNIVKMTRFSYKKWINLTCSYLLSKNSEVNVRSSSLLYWPQTGFQRNRSAVSDHVSMRFRHPIWTSSFLSVGDFTQISNSDKKYIWAVTEHRGDAFMGGERISKQKGRILWIVNLCPLHTHSQWERERWAWDESFGRETGWRWIF